MERSRHSAQKFPAAAIAVAFALCLLVAVVALSQPSRPFASAEVKFSDASTHGLSIVPASCSSRPGDTDAKFGCSGSKVLCPNGFDAPNGKISQCPSSGGGGCPAGTNPVNGQCVASCSSGSTNTCPCPTGFTRQNGECVAPQCSIGYALQQGICKFSGCPNGYTTTTNASGAKVCQVGACGTGNICVGTSLYNRSGVVVNGSCEQSLVQLNAPACSSGTFVAPTPSATIRAVPLLLTAGTTTVVSWRAKYVSNCSVSGTNADGTVNSHDTTSGSKGVWVGLTGQKTSSPIRDQTIYTLTCTAENGSPFAQSVTVNIVPTFQEQ